MAVFTWDGSSGTAWNTSANWDVGSGPSSGDDVVIPNVTNDPVLDSDRTINSLTIASGGNLDGNGNELTIDGEADGTGVTTNGYAVRLETGSIITGTDTDITITLASAHTNVYFQPTTGALRNITINGSGNTVNLRNATSITGDLTITAGTLDTYSASNNALTVTGKTTIGNASHSSEDQATLTCNASAISLGSTKSDDYAIEMLQGGTFVGGSANHTTGAIKQAVTNTKFTFTSATTTINAEYTTADRMFELTVGKAYNANGRITLAVNATTSIQWNGPSGDTGPHNLRLNDNGITLRPRSALIIEGYLTIDNGTFTTSHPSSANNALTVAGDVTINDGDTLTGNASAISMGSLTIASGGTYIATSGTTTITGGYNGYTLLNHGTFTHNKGKVLVDFTPSSNWYMQCNEYYDLEIKYNNNGYISYMVDQSGAAVTILGDLTVTMGMFEMYTAGDTLDVHGNTYIDGGIFENNADQTGQITHHGLVTLNSGTYKLNSGQTVKVGGFRKVGGTLTIA
jgi:hypothetical protein